MATQDTPPIDSKHEHIGPSKDYILPRSYASAARLNLQHYLLKQTIGHTLHPSIEVPPTAKIADIATGTGIWLLDLSLTLPTTVQLSGFDISADQFPPTSSLPSNITFDTFDASTSVPAHLVGQFDIVHVGVVFAVIEGNFTTWLSNIIQLLKPGGYLQWNEADFPGFARRMKSNPYSADQYPGLSALAQMNAENADRSAAMTAWLGEMDREFVKAGLEVLEFGTVEPPARLARALSENALLAVEEVARKRGRGEVVELVSRCGEDLRRGGLYMGLVPIVAVGRKLE